MNYVHRREYVAGTVFCTKKASKTTFFDVCYIYLPLLLLTEDYWNQIMSTLSLIESEGIKTFSAKSGSGYPGSFPVGFLKWVQSLGYWGEDRIYLCCGGVIDPEADRVDIQTELDLEKLDGRRGKHPTINRTRTVKTTANIIADARNTGLASESYDWVMIDPPYSKILAHGLYGTEEVYSGIYKFIEEGMRLLRPGGYLCTLTYEIPRIHPEADLVARWGVYQIPTVRSISAFFVFKKHGERRKQGLERWM